MTDRQILTADQMRAAEQAMFDAGTTVSELMEIAAGGAAEWVRRLAAGRSVTVLCGPGNNGGDGYVIARRLRDRGWEVDLFFFGDAAKLPPDAKANHDLWVEMGTVNALDPAEMARCERPDLFVDAVFGTGLTRPLPESLSVFVRAMT